MEIEIHNMDSAELVDLYHRTNSEIRRQLIDGRTWTELKHTVGLLTDLSIEISKRKISLRDGDNTPADTQLR